MSSAEWTITLMKFIHATWKSGVASSAIKYSTSFSKRYCSPFACLKLSTAWRILMCPPLTRHTAASSSMTVMTVLFVQ